MFLDDERHGQGHRKRRRIVTPRRGAVKTQTPTFVTDLAHDSPPAIAINRFFMDAVGLAPEWPSNHPLRVMAGFAGIRRGRYLIPVP